MDEEMQKQINLVAETLHEPDALFAFGEIVGTLALYEKAIKEATTQAEELTVRLNAMLVKLAPNQLPG